MKTDSPYCDQSRTTRLCAHSRLIDEVRTPEGLKTGQVRCLECGAVFEDPVPDKENSRER